MERKCSKCWGELDTGYVCRACGHYDPPQEIYYSDSTAIMCTMGHGWCPIHGDDCQLNTQHWETHNKEVSR